ncbi:MAG: PQQ-binding-like beta-propeller repeat protein [Candidatus Hydrogenedentes bacterium]|nr:PQQ-binding-like beta-propeller repeat protein [Candidatus Hydrogenedentota bacterium]
MFSKHRVWFCICAACMTITAMVVASADDQPSRFPADHPLRSAPVVEPFDVNQLPKAELLATPEVRTLLGYTRRPLHLPDGHTMALFSFSYSAPANWIFLVDGRDLSSTRHAIPNNDIASHGAALGADGNIYIMPYNTARAYCFDTKTHIFEQLPTDVAEGEYTWDALGGSDGCIYFGTYPNAIFGEYNPETKSWALWPNLVPDTKYITGFSEDAEGRICFKAWGPGEVWMAFDPETRAFETIEAPSASGTALPAPPADDESYIASVVAGESRFAVSHPTGRVWDITSVEPRLMGDTGLPAETTWWLKATGDEVFGVSYFGGLFRYGFADGAFATGQLDNRAAAGNSIMFVETVTPECVIGANYSQQNLFRVNPNTGEIVESNCVVARVSGEPMCAVGFGGKAYVGIYVQSLISVYDPAQPFAFRTNPRELIELGTTYEQTRPRAAVTDGRLVYITSDSAYNKLGGALAIVDPAAEQIDVYHHLIQDQNLPTLAYDPSTRLLWGGTDRWGQMRSHPPTQESALIYSFDPNTRTVVDRLTLWPGADVVTVHGVSKEGVLVASNSGGLALLDTQSKEVLWRGPIPANLAGTARRGSDGMLYLLGDGVLYQWDMARGLLSAKASVIDGIYLTESAPDLWIIASSKSLFSITL